MSTIKLKVPGKLFIAGEYAVLEKGYPSVVIAVNRYMTLTIEKSEENQLFLPDLGLEAVKWAYHAGDIQFNVEDPRLQFIANTLVIVHEYLAEQGMQVSPSHLTVTSELNDESGKKYGLGSSAAIVVGVVSALLAHHGMTIETNRDTIFKLATLAHVKTQGSGSGADIAASTYGGWLEYRAFQAPWILDQLQQDQTVRQRIEKPWPYLSIQLLTKPSNLFLSVGWTGMTASTGSLINTLHQWRDHHQTEFNAFLKASEEAVEAFVAGFKQHDALVAIQALRKNRQAFVTLGEQAGMAIETPKLTELADVAESYQGSGKSSGAGGGDCGIAFVSTTKQAKALQHAWKQIGIEPLDLDVSSHGAIVVKA